MSNNGFALLRTGQAIPAGQVPQVPFADFRATDRGRRGRRAARRRPLRGRTDLDREGGPLRRPRRQQPRASCVSARRRWTRTVSPR